MTSRTKKEKEAAEYLGVSVPFLRASRSPGKRKNPPEGPPWLKYGRAVRYDVADLDAWLDRQRVYPCEGGGDDA